MMRYVSLRARFNTVILAVAGFSVMAVSQLPDAGEITGFRVPEFDAVGVLKSEIFGEKANPLPGGEFIRITGLRILVYKNKDVESILTAEHCTISRKDRSAFSNADVKIEKGNVVITGKGFRWNPESQRIEILNNFHMVMVGTVKVWPLMKEKK